MADHFGGMSKWRGKFTALGRRRAGSRGEQRHGRSHHRLVLGRLPVATDLDEHLKTAEFFDVEKYPTATYKGKLGKFKDGAPTEVQGELTCTA